MKTKDIMTRYVLSVEPDASILSAIHLMLERHVSGLAVLDRAMNLVGIVTEGDFLRRTEVGTRRQRPRWLEFLIGPGKLADEYVRASGRQVRDVMTPDVHTISEDAPLEDVARDMEKHRVKRLLVMRGNTVVGIVTRTNLMRALIPAEHGAHSSTTNDAAIRELLVAELKKEPWAPIGLINVSVKDGIVRLSGTLMDDRERAALKKAAENTPGVKAVNDQLTLVEPDTGMLIPIR